MFPCLLVGLNQRSQNFLLYEKIPKIDVEDAFPLQLSLKRRMPHYPKIFYNHLYFFRILEKALRIEMPGQSSILCGVTGKAVSKVGGLLFLCHMPTFYILKS